MDDLIRDFSQRCRERVERFEETEVKCGLVGPSGSGKSSLINAIFGEKVAAVGVVETTAAAQEFRHGARGLILVDLPGVGTANWPRDTYIERLGLLAYDCFLIVTAERFTENDLHLHRELTSRGKPCFLLRNKFDRALEDALHDSGLDEEQVRRQIEHDIRANLQPASPARLYLTSARHPARYDLGALLDDIAAALSGLKQARFIADMAAYSTGALKKKREVALELMPLYAGLAAANGLNPVPGLDIAADVALLVKMGNRIAEIYGLTSQHFEYVRRLVSPQALPGVMAKVTQFAAKYLVREGIIALLRTFAKKTAARSTSKWLPLVGPLISAGLGWRATFTLGEQMLDEAEALALEILAEVLGRE
jgi:GTP-binding protein EngB required for normal cell division